MFANHLLNLAVLPFVLTGRICARLLSLISRLLKSLMDMGGHSGIYL